MPTLHEKPSSSVTLFENTEPACVNLLNVRCVAETIVSTPPLCRVEALLMIDLQLAYHHTKHRGHACFVHKRTLSRLQEYQASAKTWLNNSDVCSEYTQGIKRKALCPQWESC